jgi:proteasome lid subunit RPN8/RPN11
MLQIAAHHLQSIHTHAVSAYPEECCGLLLGSLDQSGKIVVDVQAIANIWTPDAVDLAHVNAADVYLTKARRYWIDPADFLAAMRLGRDRDLDIIGIYHSHPDHTAIPSECDRQLAWPQYSYLIAAVHQGDVTATLSWCLDANHQFQPEEMVVYRDRTLAVKGEL